jgi:hypothetical protein
MSQISRPMQVILAVTLLFAAVWLVALRPKPADGGGSAAAPQTTPAAPGVTGLKNTIDQAHGAVTTANGDAQRAAGSSAEGTTPATGGATASTGTTAHGPAAPAGSTSASHRRAHAAAHDPARSAGHSAAESNEVRIVRSALRHDKAVALAFVDPSTADAQAVAREMLHVSRFHGRAVPLAVPLDELSRFAFITNSVAVTVSPTVVIIDRRQRATTIVGFADRAEIEQRLADALAVKPAR